LVCEKARKDDFSVSTYDIVTGGDTLVVCMLRRGKMKNAIRWAGTLLKYIAGMACWLIIFGFLQHMCLFNVGSFVDGLWMKDLHDGLVQNVIGEIAYRARNGYGDNGCGDKYIYSALYHLRGSNTEGEVKSLTSLVDVATWREVEDVSSINFTFLDSKHQYVIRYISDGADISAEDK